uniref:Uncharacterized protein n=1 Tax=Anopheles culicifacies TaxID=139723 RepID=A0A182MD00_9DIPT
MYESYTETVQKTSFKYSTDGTLLHPFKEAGSGRFQVCFAVQISSRTLSPVSGNTCNGSQTYFTRCSVLRTSRICPGVGDGNSQPNALNGGVLSSTGEPVLFSAGSWPISSAGSGRSNRSTSQCPRVVSTLSAPVDGVLLLPSPAAVVLGEVSTGRVGVIKPITLISSSDRELAASSGMSSLS